VHLHVDAARSASDAVADLVAACRRAGLVIARVHELPRTGRTTFVVELADPLPEIPAEATTSLISKDRYPISVFETGPGRCRIATIPPSLLVDLLGHPEVAPAALAFERKLQDVFDAAAGRPPVA
jgi:hypothetical protein